MGRTQVSSEIDDENGGRRKLRTDPLGSKFVPRPLSRDMLRHRGAEGGGTPGVHQAFENEIDSLLAEHDRKGRRGEETAGAEPSKPPIERLRDEFRERIIPAVDEVVEKYRAKGIEISMDATDFLIGGRGLVIDIAFAGHRLLLEGTVMSDSIAFNETRYAPDGSGTVAAGPTIRSRHLNVVGIVEFIFRHIVDLMRSANRPSRR